MTDTNNSSKTLWLLKGKREVPGWGPLEEDAKAGTTDVMIFDRGAGWALIKADAAPSNYDGMVATPPKDGLYVSENGYPIYVVDCHEVRDAKAVIAAVGDKAAAMLDEIGDADAVLQRMGLAY